MNRMVHALEQRILAARRQAPADLVLKGGKVVNVFSGEILQGDVAIQGGVVVGVGPRYRGRTEVDADGKWIAPGLIDAHLHIESSMLLPSRLAAALLPHGTTTIVSDPHEIGNVMGMAGIRFLLQESASIPFDIFFMAPSCIPATPFETSGATLGASELRELARESRILGLGEMMDYPGVLTARPQVLEKLVLFRDKILDGHAPSLKGDDLQAYVAAGIRSDHETGDLGEAREKIRSGLFLMIREGTSARDLEALLSLVSPDNGRRFCLVSDDLHPMDIQQRGHLDFVIKRAINLGLNPVTALQMASINPAEYFQLRDRGAVAPGYRADLVVLADLESFEVDTVLKDGRVVVEHGELVPFQGVDLEPDCPGSMNVAPLSPDNFRIAHPGKRARIMELIPGQILTRLSIAPVRSVGGQVASDTTEDVLKLAVVERHKGTGRIGLGLVKGFDIKRGAIASSVAHDSHNLIAVGVTDQDLWRSLEAVKEMGGGLAVTAEDRVLARVPLEVAGLMSREPLGRLTPALDAANRAALSLGCGLSEPFMCLSFLALPVIPELKLTDRGLVDVNAFSLVPLFVEAG